MCIQTGLSSDRLWNQRAVRKALEDHLPISRVYDVRYKLDDLSHYLKIDKIPPYQR